MTRQDDPRPGSGATARHGGRLRRALAAAVAMLALAAGGLAPVTALAAPPDDEELAVDALFSADLDSLVRQNAALRGGAHDDKGQLRLSLMRSAFQRVLQARDQDTIAYMDELERMTAGWAKARPDDPFVQALHGQALVSRAWWHRGGGYSNTVTENAMAAFNRHLQRAVQHLSTNGQVAIKDSLTHYTLVRIGRGLGWKHEVQRRLAFEGLAVNPHDDDLYFEVLSGTLPKWGGDANLVDRWIREATERTQASRGQELYARLYSAAAREQYEHQLFSDSRADWPRMRQGYEDWLARYPRDDIRQRMAYFACLARDRPTLQALLLRLGDRPDLESWGRNPQRVFEECLQFAAGR
jgi:transposase-like protein